MLLDAAPIALASLIFATRRADGERRWLVGATIYLLLHDLVLVAPHLAGVRFGHWNWLGKGLGIIVSVGWLRWARLGPEEVGWRLPALRSEWIAALIGTLVLAALAAGERLVEPGGKPFTLETFLFQSTMPGLDEETAFRGVLFGMLMRALHGPGRRTTASLLVTISFWIAHIVHSDDHSVTIDGFKIDTLVAAVLLMWLRTRTGSLFPSMLAHDIDNNLNVVV